MGFVGSIYLVLLAIASYFAIRNFIAAPNRFSLWSGVLSAALFLGSAGFMQWELHTLRSRHLSDEYDLPVDPPGRHLLKIRPLPEVPGCRGSLIPRVGSESIPTFLDAALWECRWKVHAPGVEVHVHDARCDCSWKTEFLFDIHSDALKNRTIELEYEVTPRTRPLLAARRLRVIHPFSYGNDLAMGYGCVEVIGVYSLGAAGVSALSLGVLLLRRRRADSKSPAPSTSGPPAPSPPATS